MPIILASTKANSSDVLPPPPLYGNVQGDRTGATVAGAFEPLPWGTNDFSFAVWRDISTGEKIRLSDQNLGAYCVEQDRVRLAGLLRVDTLAPAVQLEWACWRLNRLQAIAERIPCLAVEEELRDSAVLFEATSTGLVLEQSKTWTVRSVPQVQIGQRVELVGVQDPAMLGHVGKVGTVKPFRSYAVRGHAKVRLDGYAIDMMLPLVCLKLVVSATKTQVNTLLEQYEALMQLRRQVLARGEILQRKPEVFATVKKNRKVCGNVQSESGAKGYAFITVVQGGKRKRSSIQPSELGRYEAAYERGQEIKRLDRELRRLTKQIDRLAAIASGSTQSRLADADGKAIGQPDLHCTRDGRAGDADAAFSFVVFRWEKSQTGKLKRGQVIKRFQVMAGATAEREAVVQQQAIAFLQTLQ